MFDLQTYVFVQYFVQRYIVGELWIFPSYFSIAISTFKGHHTEDGFANYR